jgi:tellurite resistance protein TerC
MVQWYIWVGFVAFVVGVLTLDLGVLHRRAHVVPFRESALWTAVWVAVALGFAGILWAWRGGGVAGEFLAGYLIEWSLSVDNVFVFLLIFAHFAVPDAYRHRVLFWGVLGAICLRLGFILAGTALLERFHWMVFLFGGILLFTAFRFLREREGQRKTLEESLVLRAVRRILPMTEGYEGQRLFVRRGGKRLATPLVAVLVMIEVTDVVFAVDSIPAIFSVTRDAFVVFASNALAILGLRSLSFVLGGAMGRFTYLKPSLAVLLAFVGVKMVTSDWIHIPILLSLGVIVAILGSGVALSMVHGSREAARAGDGGESGSEARAG